MRIELILIDNDEEQDRIVTVQENATLADFNEVQDAIVNNLELPEPTPTPKLPDGWQLTHVDDIEHTQDQSGLYVYINWDVKTATVRLDIMCEQDAEPLMSFQGKADNVRKHTMRWLSDNVGAGNGYDSAAGTDYVGISLEHASYIGSELARANAERIDYVQG